VSDAGRTFVDVRNGDRIERREVTLGARGPARSEVLEGLADGDEVVLTPEARILEARTLEAQTLEVQTPVEQGA
jgi:hypothetical protein